MKVVQKQRGVLVLEDGRRFPGWLLGAEISASQILAAQNASDPRQRDRGYGEAVFNTSMTGYQEILTDPSYYGQIVCMTVPHVGNTGVNEQDPESSKPWCAGFVVHDICESASNWRSEGGLNHYLKTHGIPGLSGVDTRALTRHLRTQGVIRGLILPMEEIGQAEALLAKLPAFEGRDLIGEVTTQKAYLWKSPESPSSFLQPLKVVTLDFGVKWNLLRSLERLGCEIDVLPAHSSAADILAYKPDGVFLSNGPGDPAAAPYAAETVRSLVGRIPIFGVCMGHQILSLAMGAKTYKLKFGHRGGNQPVLNCKTRKVEISSHNHGYAVDEKSLPANASVTHLNLNDKTVEGMEVVGARAFSVQYHPEACPGPHDSVALFDQFIESMRDFKTECTKNT